MLGLYWVLLLSVATILVFGPLALQLINGTCLDLKGLDSGIRAGSNSASDLC